MSPCARPARRGRRGHGVRQVAGMRDVRSGVLDCDRELPAGAFDDPRVHQAGQAGAVRGGGHGEQPQVRPQHALQVQAQGEAEIGFEGSLVDFIQDHRGDAVQTGVRLKASQQQAFGDDFDAGLGRAGAVQAGAVADGFPDGFATEESHAGGGGASGEAARFQHQDAAVAPPWGVEQRERHNGGLAGTGRSNEHGVAAGVQRGEQGRERVGDGEVFGHGDRVITGCRGGVMAGRMSAGSDCTHMLGYD